MVVKRILGLSEPFHEYQFYTVLMVLAWMVTGWCVLWALPDAIGQGHGVLAALTGFGSLALGWWCRVHSWIAEQLL